MVSIGPMRVNPTKFAVQLLNFELVFDFKCSFDSKRVCFHTSSIGIVFQPFQRDKPLVFKGFLLNRKQKFLFRTIIFGTFALCN